jgi:hypothetical protein
MRLAEFWNAHTFTAHRARTTRLLFHTDFVWRLSKRWTASTIAAAHLTLNEQRGLRFEDFVMMLQNDSPHQIL